MQISLKKRIARLERFYGKVAKRRWERIIPLIKGNNVLEIGCGYGTLVGQLRNSGFFAVGIDTDEEGLRMAKMMSDDIQVVVGDAYQLNFVDKFFDTVILLDVTHHLDLDKALEEIKRVCRGRIIIYDPNPNPILRLCRKIVRHKDDEAPFKEVVNILKTNKFKVRYLDFYEVFAFPLSGGFVGIEFCPNINSLHQLLIRLDDLVRKFLRLLNLEELFCWRYLIVADLW